MASAQPEEDFHSDSENEDEGGGAVSQSPSNKQNGVAKDVDVDRYGFFVGPQYTDPDK